VRSKILAKIRYFYKLRLPHVDAKFIHRSDTNRVAGGFLQVARDLQEEHHESRE